MSKIADAEANATSLDGLVNDNGLITTLRNGPKPSWQYLVDGWESQFTTLFADGEIQIDQIVTDLQTLGDAELSSLLIGITSQADSAIAGIKSDVSEKLEQVTIEADEAIESIQNDTASAIASAQNRTDAAVDQLTNDANELLDNIEQSALSRSKISTPVTLSQGQTEITIAGFNASLSAYYVKDLNSDAPRYRLFSGANEDYTFDSVTTDTITLNQTYDAGTKVYAVSLDPAGAGVSRAESQFASKLELKLSDVSEGTIALIPSLGNAKYLIKTGVDAEIGDIEFTDTRVAVLQPNEYGDYDCRWFGVADDQDDTKGSQIELLRDAAKRAAISEAAVIIPNIKINVSGLPIAEEIFWKISPNADFNGLPGVAPTFVFNMNQLGGKLVLTREPDSRLGSIMYYGDPAYTFQSKSGRSQTTGTVAASSPIGAASLLGATATSLNSSETPDQSGIGVSSKVLNDNESVSHSAWGGYDEAIRYNGEVNGNTYGRETSFSNGGSQAGILKPYDNLDVGNSLIVGHAISCGLNNYTGPTTAFSYWSRTAASTRANKGLVVLDDSIAQGAYLAEVIAMPENHGFSFYSDTGGMSAYIKYVYDGSDGNTIRMGVFNDTNESVKVLNVDFGSISYGSNSADLGKSSKRFKSIYLQNAPDVVSDRDKKTEIRGLTSDELNAGLELARNVQFFKWIDEVNKKGSDNSYLHASVIAQEAYDILTNNNLDASKYGLVSNESNNWSVLPTELNMLMSAALVAEQDNIKSRLDALEV